MRYCPTCDAPRTPEQEDELGHCRVCGTPLLDDPAGVTTAAVRPPGAVREGDRNARPAGERTAGPDDARDATGSAGDGGSASAATAAGPRQAAETVRIQRPAAPSEEPVEGAPPSASATAGEAATPVDDDAGPGGSGADRGEEAPEEAPEWGDVEIDDWLRKRRQRDAAGRPQGGRGGGQPLGTGAGAIRQPWRTPTAPEKVPDEPTAAGPSPSGRPTGTGLDDGSELDTGPANEPTTAPGTGRGTEPGAAPVAVPPPPPPPAAGGTSGPGTTPSLGTPAYPSEAAPALDYQRLAAEVEANVREGYELFGLVGGAGSGKTHALKALTYLLRGSGTQSDRAAFEFMQATTPAPTGGKVGHYDFQGPSQRWTFVDAGGELYAGLRRNDWDRFAGQTARLSRWLHLAHGIFCFLHLRPGHFGSQVLDHDPTLESDPGRRAQLEKGRQEALANQEELAFFRNFFLFLRALEAEEGDVGRVIEACRRAPTLEEALEGYARTTPLLDVPVMFFFSQADTYQRDDFAVGPGAYVDPRRLEIPASVFTARYLPTLFAGVSTQVRRFKFDFLQSYEEAPTRQTDRDGRPLIKTYWSPPDDPRSLLSAGLLSGLEFVLRNQPRERRFWELPELSTRQALLLHRRLHPGTWAGVAPGLLGSWRNPTPAGEDGGAGPPAPPGDGSGGSAGGRP